MENLIELRVKRLREIRVRRLRELRLQHDLMQKDVAGFIGVDRTTYVKYESGSSDPSLDTLSKLAGYYGVSTDYILGRTDDPTDYEDGDLIASLPKELLDHFDGDVRKACAVQEAIEQDAMAEVLDPYEEGIGPKLCRERKARGVRVDVVAEKLGVDVALLTSWEGGSVDIPSSAMFRNIAALGLTLPEFFAPDSGLATVAAHRSDGEYGDLPKEAVDRIEELKALYRMKYKIDNGAQK